MPNHGRDTAAEREWLKPYYVYLMRGVAKDSPAARGRQPLKRRKNARAAATPRDTEVPLDSTVYLHVGKSRAPIRKVQRHNRSSIRLITNRKLMNRLCGTWRLEEWFGPFATRAKARAFQRQWTANLRRSAAPPSACVYHYSAHAPYTAAKTVALPTEQ